MKKRLLWEKVWFLLKQKGPLHLDEIRKELNLDYGQATGVMQNNRKIFKRVSRGVYGAIEDSVPPCPYCRGTGYLKEKAG